MAFVVPGVYVNERISQQSSKITMNRSCVAGFVGIAERGPLQTAVRLTSFEQFQERFGGFSGPGLLPFAVYGFFNSGGKECLVVRTASQKGESSIASASLTLNNRQHKPIGGLQALSSGTWGNGIATKFWYAIAGRYELVEVDSGGRWVVVGDSTEFKVGDTVRFQAEGRIVYRVVAAVDADRLTFDRPVSGLSHVSDRGTQLERLAIHVSVTHGRRVEEFLFLSPNPQDDRYFASWINRHSQLVRCEMSSPEAQLLSEFGPQPLSGGRDGVVGLEPGDFVGLYEGAGRGRGLGLFEAFDDVAVIAIPDVEIFGLNKPLPEAKAAARVVQQSLLIQAERLANRFALLDAPSFLPLAEQGAWAAQFDSMFGAIYYPAIRMIDPLDPVGVRTTQVPTAGHVAGVIAAIDADQGPIRAPANVYLPGVVGLAAEVTDATVEQLYPARVNTLKNVPGRGVKVWGARTLSSNPEWKYISVRRTFSRIASALRAGTGWAVFEVNDARLRKRLLRHVSAFLIDLWHEGALVGATPDQAFYVRCDEELNPPEDVESGRITVQAGIALAKPTEFIVVSIVSEREGSHIVVEEESFEGVQNV